MFFPEGQVRVFLYGQPVNMRETFDGLYALAKHVMHQRQIHTAEAAQIDDSETMPMDAAVKFGGLKAQAVVSDEGFEYK